MMCLGLCKLRARRGWAKARSPWRRRYSELWAKNTGSWCSTMERHSLGAVVDTVDQKDSTEEVASKWSWVMSQNWLDEAEAGNRGSTAFNPQETSKVGLLATWMSFQNWNLFLLQVVQATQTDLSSLSAFNPESLVLMISYRLESSSIH